MRKIQNNFLFFINIIFCFILFSFFENKIYAQLPKTFIKEELPTLRSGPPLNIQAAYDKEVLLEVTPGDDYSSQNSHIIWSINNKKICTGVYCPIVLKESEYLDRAPILDIITYNEYGGTTYTYEFEIRSKEGFDSKSLNKETEYVKPKNDPIDPMGTVGPVPAEICMKTLYIKY